MEYGDITVKGKLVNQVLSTLPDWSATDEGRTVYVEDEDKFYYGTSTDWVKVNEVDYLGVQVFS